MPVVVSDVLFVTAEFSRYTARHCVSNIDFLF